MIDKFRPNLLEEKFNTKDFNIIRIYERYAPHYDRLFGRVFEAGRRETVKRLQCKANEKILEVGVGTGISLPLYPGDTFVHGIDISPSMLEKASQKLSEYNLSNVTLQVMDAQCMEFGDNTFDKVVAMYVASVVSEPQKLVAEMKRVCKPGGDLFIINHFSCEYQFIHFFEKMLSYISQHLGWEPAFCMKSFIEMCELDVVKIHKRGLLGYWPLIHARNS